MAGDDLTNPSIPDANPISGTDPFGSNMTLTAPKATPSDFDPHPLLPKRMQTRRSPRNPRSTKDANAYGVTIVGASARMATAQFRSVSKNTNDATVNFEMIAPQIMSHFMQRYKWTDYQAAGALGSSGTESDGFIAFHQYGQPDGKGGYGYGQWTWPSRRKGYFQNAQSLGLDPRSYAGSVSFYDKELDKNVVTKKVCRENQIVVNMRKTSNLRNATQFFSDNYENPGAPNMPSRQDYAQQALDAFTQQHGH